MMIPRTLTYRQGFSADPASSGARNDLMREVFDFAPLRSGDEKPAWCPFGFFDRDGRCVAAVEASRLDLRLDGRAACATAIRLVAVAPAHRGEGLFRALMAKALAWCEAACEGPTLLYAEDHALYARFGFVALPQHAFVGAAPMSAAGAAATPLDRAAASRHFDRLAPRRAAISQSCAIVGADDLFREILRGDEPCAFAYADDLDALVVYEADGSALVVADIVAAEMPTMAQIVGKLGARQAEVRTLFPPDQLDWAARPVGDDTGLMIRGAVPDALRRPFMLPPTTAF